MNNNPNSNVSEQSNTQVNTTSVDNQSVINNSSNAAGSVVNQPVTSQASSVSSQTVVQPQQVTQPVVQSVVQEEKTAPVAPQQDRVQLINDKPKLHAVIGSNGAVPTENKSEDKQNDQPEIVKNIPIDDNSNQKGGGLRTFFLFVLFGGLFAMIIFLPDISNYIETQKYLRNNPVEEKITTGILTCSIENSTETLDYKQNLEFSFSDNELTKLVYTTKTRGSIGLDDNELELLKNECDQLVTYADKLSGISVSCELLDGVLTRTQKFDYGSIKVDDAITAYIEAGGAYPDYENMENIDNIERDMNASGYSCERVK